MKQGESRDRKQEITKSSCSLSFLAKKANPKDAQFLLQPALVIYWISRPHLELPAETIKFEERHGKQNIIYRKFANEFFLFLFIDNIYWKTGVFQSIFHVWKTHRTYGL